MGQSLSEKKVIKLTSRLVQGRLYRVYLRKLYAGDLSLETVQHVSYRDLLLYRSTLTDKRGQRRVQSAARRHKGEAYSVKHFEYVVV